MTSEEGGNPAQSDHNERHGRRRGDPRLLWEPRDGTKLSVEVVNVEGRQHPVEVTYSLQHVPRQQVKEAITKRVLQINQTEPLPGDILAFMTGQEEIEACQKLIEGCVMALPKDVPSVRVFPLYGQLSIEAQAEAFGTVKEKMTRKVVLATNIAETSVTVPGVRYVIDCGDAKVKLFEPTVNVESLRAVPISKSSVIQRTGRAGREAPGKCYRLYTREEHGKFMDITLPEIIRIDVIGAILTMKVHGINDIYSFPLMDPPDPLSTEKALLQLHFMRALSDTTGEITEIGRKMALFPVTAPFSRVLLAAADPENHCLLEAIDIISCLTGGDTVFSQVRLEEEAEDVDELRKELFRREGDLLTYLMTMQAYAAENTDRVEWCRAPPHKPSHHAPGAEDSKATAAPVQRHVHAGRHPARPAAIRPRDAGPCRGFAQVLHNRLCFQNRPPGPRQELRHCAGPAPRCHPPVQRLERREKGSYHVHGACRDQQELRQEGERYSRAVGSRCSREEVKGFFWSSLTSFASFGMVLLATYSSIRHSSNHPVFI